MKNIITALFALCISVFGMPAWSANVGPFGLEVGVATIEDVRAAVGSKSALSEAGVNKYTGGQMLQGTGGGLGIDGLHTVFFIFSEQGTLEVAMLTVTKSSAGFQELLAGLSKRYKLVEKRIPFVGDAYARLVSGKSGVELDSPHLSFDMTLTYQTATFKKRYQEVRAAEQAARKHAQENAL